MKTPVGFLMTTINYQCQKCLDGFFLSPQITSYLGDTSLHSGCAGSRFFDCFTESAADDNLNTGQSATRDTGSGFGVAQESPTLPFSSTRAFQNSYDNPPTYDSNTMLPSRFNHYDMGAGGDQQVDPIWYPEGAINSVEIAGGSGCRFMIVQIPSSEDESEITEANRFNFTSPYFGTSSREEMDPFYTLMPIGHNAR